MRNINVRWMVVSAAAIAILAGQAMARPAGKEKSRDQARPQAPADKQAGDASPAAPEVCPVGCPNCPWNQNNTVAARDIASQPRGPGAGRGQGFRGGQGGGPPWMRSSGNQAPKIDGKADTRSPMEVFHSLLNQHDKIRRTVEEIPGGVFTVTTSADPSVARDIKIHVWQMKARIENGQPLRRWDPLFDELFKHGSKIRMKIEETKDGAKVTETSDDAQVAKLIRQHAIRGVSEFVKDGFDRAHKPSPLPEGYVAAEQAKPVQAKEEKPADSRPRWGRQGRTGP